MRRALKVAPETGTTQTIYIQTFEHTVSGATFRAHLLAYVTQG